MSLASTHYQALQLKPSATHEQVIAAYRRLSLKYHPESNHDDLPHEHCVALLRQVSNAFEVLTNKRLRTRYDALGVAGIEGYTFKDPQRVFDQFFGTANPFAAVLPSEPTNVSDHNPESAFQDQAPLGVKKGRTAAAALPVSLSELYKGCQKRIKVKRQRVFGSASGVQQEVKYLHVQVPPGTADGTKIRFENEGDEVPGQLPSDIVFEITSVPHPVYERRGNDLVCRKKISLLQALTNCITKVETLDGRMLSLATHTIITPQTRKVVRGEGMPIPAHCALDSAQNADRSLGTMLPPLHQQPKRYGDLIIEYDIQFPSHVSQHQKQLLHEALRPSQR